MMGYDFEVVYRKGALNTIANALSKKPEFEQGQLLSISSATTDMFDKIQKTWVEDEELKKIVQELEIDKTSLKKFNWQNNQLRRKWKLVVGRDEALRRELLTYYHDSSLGGHSGVHATVKRISQWFYWKGLRKDVRNWVRECPICQKCKADYAASPGLLQPLPIPDRIWQDVSMDSIEGLPKYQGKKIILVVVDRLSK